MASRQLVIFKVNDEDFGIDINQVNSIEKPMEIFKVPNTPDYVEGLINLRGKVYTVFNLRKKFNLPTMEFDDSTKIIIVKEKSVMVGFIVDEVNEIITFDDSNIESTPEVIAGFDRKYLGGVAKRDDKIVLILDLVNILSLEDQKLANSSN
ncbi:MAG: chemotaxis protein CheW [Clostridia bacterium]|nr:chemotaxis protein CheW [Clostridia bacterium]